MKKISLLGIILLTLLFLETATGRERNVSAKTDEAQATIIKYINHMGHDWDAFAEQYESGQRLSMKEFLSDSENQINHLGVLNVINAELKEVREVTYDEAMEQLVEKYNQNTAKFFALKIDYKVYEDTGFFANGTHYNLISLVPENGSMKIREFSCYEAEMTKLFDTDTVGKLNVFATANNKKAKTKRKIPSPKKNVIYGVVKNGKYSLVKVLSYEGYCLGVVAGECRGKEFDGQARKAIIMAVKTYTWHYLEVPIDPVMNINIKSTMQMYRPDKVNENSKVKTEYSQLRNIWMESYSGAIFEALYKAGQYKSQSAYKGKGELKQNGCRYLVKVNGKNFYECIHYYYDRSPASKGGAVRFFDENKNVINK